MNGEHHPQHENAVAGPSSLKLSTTAAHPVPGVQGTTGSMLSASMSDPDATMGSPSSPVASLSFPLLYLPPPAPLPPKQHLASTQDLLKRLKLLPAYDKYVRPYSNVSGQGASDATNGDGGAMGMASTPGVNGVSPGGVLTPGTVDKGKGREMPMPGGDVDMQDAMDGDDDGDGKGEKKKKNSYKYLIKGIPGKHSMKKDEYLTTMMLVPPKQRTRIRRFDEKTQEDAFTVSLEGLKGWNINALVVESAQAREDRKKRKEAKRVAKLQSQVGPPGAATSALSIPPTGTSTPIAQPQPVQAARPAGPPKHGVGPPRPGSRAGNGVVTNGKGAGGGGPRPISAVPRPGSAVPRPGSAVPKPGTPVIARTGTPMEVDQQRGKKREREDGGGGGLTSGVNGVHVNGGNGPAVGGLANGYTNGNGNGNVNGLKQPAVVMNAKAGTGNVRPRPIKKQRMDMQGQARDVSAPVQQQPTPQGV